MLLGFLVGLVTGFIMAIPPGPVNFAIFEKSIHGRHKAAILLIFGAVAGDTIFCFLAVVYQLSTEWLRLVKLTFSVVGGVFLVGLGIYYLFKKKYPANTAAVTQPESSRNGLFITGLMFTLSNPFFIIALIAITELYYSLQILHLDVFTNIVFIMGFQIGAFVWLAGMGKIAARNQHHFKGFKDKIQKFCGVAYIFFGIYMLAKFIRLIWPEIN